MKKVLVLVVLLLLGGGAGAYFLLPGGGDDAAAKEAEPAPIVVPTHHYMTLPALTITVFRDDAPAGQFSTELVIEVADPGNRVLVNENISRVRDAMLRRLHVLLERETRTGVDVTVGALKQNMLAVVQRELGADIVIDLFVSGILRKDV